MYGLYLPPVNFFVRSFVRSSFVRRDFFVDAQFFSTTRKILKILNGRLHPEDGSDRPQTWGKRVSDDSRHLIFRRRKIFFGKNFSKKFWRKINNSIFWRSYAGLSVTGRCALKSYCLQFIYFLSTTLGEGVKDSICVFEAHLEPKMTVTISSFSIMII